ncbi:MAG: ABC transporter substrate-binding protein [Dehalococcoidia bacterium]|nr:ABC transporter substrate-binding protein [Dehalococcoidia bacterium]
MKFPHVVCILVLVAMLGLSACATKAGPAPAPEKPAPVSQAETPKLTREQQLIEGAKKEGEVNLYSQSWPVGSDFDKAFQAKYPFLKFKVWDAPRATAILDRLAEEAKIGRYPADVISFAETDFVALVGTGLLQEYNWPNQGWTGQPNSKLFMNIGSATYYPSYNTNLVTPAELPKTFEDLKNPKWRGRAAISTSGRGIPLYTAYIFGKGKVDHDKSESFWKEVVASTRPRVMSGYELPNAMLAAGEFAILLMSASSTNTKLMWQGGPIAPVALEVAPVHGYSLGMVKNAVHPNAAQLFIDFITSAEGNLLYAANAQSIMASNPEAAKKAKTNLFYKQYGLNLVPMPAEIYTTEDTERASRFWSIDMPKAAAR